VTGPHAAADVVRRALRSAATLGSGRLVCVDGPAGSGKTTFAAAVGAAVPSDLTCRVLHMDDIYPGWTGLAAGVAGIADGVVAPHASGTTGSYRRFDWEADQLAERVEVPPVDVLVVEGVGSGARAYAKQITTLVWLEAQAETRLARGLARDGEGARLHWLAWMDQEQAWFDREGTRARADLVLRTDSPTAEPA